MPVEELLPPDSYRDNFIISGGDSDERMKLCEMMVRNTFNVKYPMIILHTGNTFLENIVAGNQLGIVINKRNPIFDVFAEMEFDEILQFVTDTNTAKYAISPAARYVLEVAYELSIARNRSPYFYWYAKCPFLTLGESISDRLKKGLITQDNANNLNTMLAAGQSETTKIAAFFSDMKAQLDYISIQDPKTVQPVSMLSAIRRNQILCIDIKSSTNAMLLEMMGHSINIALNRGLNFSLLLDDVAFANNNIFLNIISQASNHQNIILSKDLFSSVGGNENLFATLIGGVDKTVVFAHGSNISCSKWSEYLGQYDKIDVSNSNSSGWFQSNRWASSAHQSQTENMVRELKVKPEQISRLSYNEAFIFDRQSGSLIQTMIG
jgi:hypothetical protein